MPFEVISSQKDQTLPMILNLRGDEVIVDEFTYDSDQAMAYLGIKRSRLNQISGRELRVARIRRDRYIRPVYREQDLKDYLDWTRATATHLSSSKAIEQAVENLDDRFTDLLQVFNEKLEQVSETQKSFVRAEIESLPAKLPKATSFQTDFELDAPKPLIQVDKVLIRHGESLQKLSLELDKLSQKLDTVHGTLNYFIPEFKEISVAQRSLRFDFEQKFELLSDALLRMGQEFLELRQGQIELQAALDKEALERTALRAEASIEEQRKTPRRHRQTKARGYSKN